MLDPAGRIVAGTMSNLFLVLNGLLVTPDLSRAGVAGIMRDLVMEAARYLGHDVVVSSLGIADLEPAGEVFVCNSLIGVWPVVRLGERAWPVGALTRTLQASLASRGLIATAPGPGRS